MKTKYPQYRVSQWLDTSDKSMKKAQVTIIYGVQTMREKGGLWMHCANRKVPMHFDSLEKASAACESLRIATKG